MGFTVCIRSTVGDYSEQYRTYPEAHKKYCEYAIIFPSVDLIENQTGEVILTNYQEEEQLC